MENKLQELTSKLLSEGVEAGKAEAGKIVAEAEAKAAAIVAQAQAQAEAVVAAAKKDSQTLKDNTMSELRMFAEQSVNALKTRITDVLADQTIAEVAGKATADKDFMNQFILTLAQKWGESENITIAAKDAESLKILFAEKAKALLDKGVKIEGVHGQKAEFTIQPEKGGYKVNIGTEEFENYFKSFLRPQLVEMLF